MQGFKKAQAEYESRMFAPYDNDGSEYDKELEAERAEEFAEWQAEMMMDRIWNDTF